MLFTVAPLVAASLLLGSVAASPLAPFTSSRNMAWFEGLPTERCQWIAGDDVAFRMKWRRSPAVSSREKMSSYMTFRVRDVLGGIGSLKNVEIVPAENDWFNVRATLPTNGIFFSSDRYRLRAQYNYLRMTVAQSQKIYLTKANDAKCPRHSAMPNPDSIPSSAWAPRISSYVRNGAEQFRSGAGSAADRVRSGAGSAADRVRSSVGIATDRVRAVGQETRQSFWPSRASGAAAGAAAGASIDSSSALSDSERAGGMSIHDGLLHAGSSAIDASAIPDIEDVSLLRNSGSFESFPPVRPDSAPAADLESFIQDRPLAAEPSAARPLSSSIII